MSYIRRNNRKLFRNKMFTSKIDQSKTYLSDDKPDFEEPIEPTLDQQAERLGFQDYKDYCDEYWQGHTGGELGEPSCIDDDIELEDGNSENTEEIDDDLKSDDYQEGFVDGLEEGYSSGYDDGYEDGYDDGWDDCDSFDNNDW